MFQFHFNEAQFLTVPHYNEIKSFNAHTLHFFEPRPVCETRLYLSDPLFLLVLLELQCAGQNIRSDTYQDRLSSQILIQNYPL